MTNPLGSYCGPYWSDGKLQQSVAGKATPQHEFDASCKDHDREYSESEDAGTRNRADQTFYHTNMGKGYLRSGAAVLVSGNKYFRKSRPSLRGAQPTVAHQAPPTCKAVSFRDQLKSKKLNTEITMTKQSKQKSRANMPRGSAAVAYSTAVGIGAAKIGSQPNGGTIIRHREYVGPVVGDTGLSILGRNVNPGLATIFPWLATIAANYEKYKMRKLAFQFITSSGTSTGGRVGLAFGYNPSEKIPLNKQEFFSIVPNREEAPWEDIYLQVPCNGETKYVRFTSPTEGSVNTYDMGVLITMTGNNASASTLGDLFVEYEVELLRPHYGRVLSEAATIINPASGFPLGTGFTIDYGIEVVSWVTASTLEFQAPGDFQVTYYGTGAGTAPLSADWTLVPIGNSDLQKTDIHTTIDNGATQFGLVYIALLKNVQVGDRLTYTSASWGQTNGGLTVTRMSQH